MEGVNVQNLMYFWLTILRRSKKESVEDADLILFSVRKSRREGKLKENNT